MVDYYYVVADYFGTGEGVTKCLLITRAYPSIDDLDENYELRYSSETVALKQFDEIFGSFFGRGADIYTKDLFLEQFEQFIPDFTKRVINNEVKTPGNFKWFAEMHINYS